MSPRQEKTSQVGFFLLAYLGFMFFSLAYLGFMFFSCTHSPPAKASLSPSRVWGYRHVGTWCEIWDPGLWYTLTQRL